MARSTQQQRNPARRLPFPLFEDENESMSFSSLPTASTSQRLPSNHFLAQRPITPPPESPPLRSSALPDTSSLAAADFDVSVETGFLPPQEPVQSLGELGSGWREMEDCLKAAVKEVEGISGGGVGKMSESFRQRVRLVSDSTLSLFVCIVLKALTARTAPLRRHLGSHDSPTPPKSSHSPCSSRSLLHAFVLPFTNCRPSFYLYPPSLHIGEARRPSHPHLRRHRSLGVETPRSFEITPSRQRRHLHDLHFFLLRTRLLPPLPLLRIVWSINPTIYVLDIGRNFLLRPSRPLSNLFLPLLDRSLNRRTQEPHA